jgi:hypothetical protein
MARKAYRYYSVYRRKDDSPVIIHGTTQECMATMKVTKTTFYNYGTRTRTGAPCKYDIYVDDPEEDEEDGC